MFAARVGDLASARLLGGRGRQRQRHRCLGRERDDARGARRFGGRGELSPRPWRRRECVRRRLHRAPCRGHASRRHDGARAALTPRRRECAAENVDAHAPLVARFQFRPRARGRDAVLAGRPVQQPRRDADSAWSRRRSTLRASWRSRRRRTRRHRLSASPRCDDGVDGGGRHGRRRRRGCNPNAAIGKR